jgi:endoglucanase Acf2
MMSAWSMLGALLSCAPVSAWGDAPAKVEPLGSGSISRELPPGAKEPAATIYATAALRQRSIPTNDWWSSLAWMPLSERQYPHPLAVCAAAPGLRVYYPGPRIRADDAAIFGFMPPDSGDLTLGHSARGDFPEARVCGFSDWFVSAAFGDADVGMVVSYGHGCPFVFAAYAGGMPTVTCRTAPRIWSGDRNSPVLGITIDGCHYGLFGPSDATWDGLDGNVLTCRTHKTYFSLAVLPDANQSTLTLFRRHAYAHVDDTRVTWSYDEKTATVTTDYSVSTVVHEGDVRDTIFALYPHQWRHTSAPRLPGQYASVRGPMQLTAGSSFQTTLPFPGVLPCLPDVGGCDRAEISHMFAAEIAAPVPGVRDTYAEGKWLGKQATLLSIAQQYRLSSVTATLQEQLRQRLETWFTATDDAGRLKQSGLFYYNAPWGTLIGYPASFGTDTELNDHHFHYGYFIRAAAEIALRNTEWASAARYGDVVKWLIRDIASPDRDDPRFPFLRNFDPYAGHSWASGHAKFGDGNNHESSSEAMNAWYGILLWGQATGDRRLRDLGAYLYTTELAAIEEYWFDVHDENHPASYRPSVVTMVWGGKGANGTWFSAEPEMVHGINWLPLHGGSLYLGRFPEYVDKNYQALVNENGGTQWGAWSDLIWMYRALSHGDDALRQCQAGIGQLRPEQGNSLVNTYHWVTNLAQLGHVARSITADAPCAMVFERDDRRTYVAYNPGPQTITVQFSTGVRLIVDPHVLAHRQEPR